MSDAASHLVHCPICFEVFTNPRALPCLHTFCQMCLEEYIAATASRGQLNPSFQCPVCRREISPPSADHFSKWASQFEINHLINSLIASTSEAKKDDHSQIHSNDQDSDMKGIKTDADAASSTINQGIQIFYDIAAKSLPLWG